jgi:hypothetical protein
MRWLGLRRANCLLHFLKLRRLVFKSAQFSIHREQQRATDGSVGSSSRKSGGQGPVRMVAGGLCGKAKGLERGENDLKSSRSSRDDC